MTRRALRRRSPRFEGLVEELEPRLLFNADIAAVLPDPALATTANDVMATPQVQALPPLNAAQTQTATPTSDTSQASTTAKPIEIVFVDARVENAQKLLADITAQQDGSRTFEVHWLDAQHDGITQISQVLDGRHDIAALHIVSHGTDGELELGSTLLNDQNLSAYSQQLSNWQQALVAHADLMIYGCDVAETAAGKHFVDDLSLLTGADVAASTDLTGAKALGGNWTLEYHDGQIQTASIIQTPSADEWQGLLGLPTNGSETGIPVTGGSEATLTNRQVASDSNGNFVVIWQDGTNIVAQRYTAAGATNGGTLTVASSGSPTNAQVAMNASGAFVVAWNDATGNLLFRTYTNTGTAGTITTVAAKSSGTVGYPFYSATDTYTYSNATVGINTAGDFVVAYHEHLNSSPDVPWYSTSNADTIKWKAYTAAGSLQGSANSATVSSSSVGNADPSIGMNGAGAFVVSYTDSSGKIFVQRYTSARAASGSAGDITGGAGGTQSSAAMDSSGNYVVAYNKSGVIYFRVYNSGGTATTGVTQANLNPGGTTPTNTRASPSVSMDTSGNFTISWQNTSQDGSGTGVYMRQFNGSGVSSTSDNLVNTTTSGNQQYSSVALTGTNAVIVWSGNGTGDASGVFFQRYNVANVPPTLTATASNPTFTEAAGVGTQAAAVSMYSGAAVSTVESGQTITSLLFTITGVVDGANDVFTFDGKAIGMGANSSGTTTTNGMSYSVTVSSGTAVVALSIGAGISTTAAQTLVNGITYQNTSTDNPTSGNRVLTLVQIQDNGGTASGGIDTTSLSVTSTVAVAARNDAPTLTATGSSPTFTEAAGLGTQAAAVGIFSGAAASTIEAGQTVTSLTFTVSGLVDGANELIYVDGSTLNMSGNSSGTTATNAMSYTVSIASGTATITLTSALGISTANTQTLVNGITYQNTNTDAPTGGNRVFTLTQIKDNGGTANSGADTTTLAIASTVNVKSVNDAPTLTSTASNPTFTEAAGVGTQAAAVNLYSGTAVSTIESSQTINSLTFTVSGIVDGASEKISFDGTAVTLGANSSGTTSTNGMSYSVSIVSGTATVTLTKVAGITSAATQTLVNGITYQNISTDNPTGGNRIFTLTQVKDNGGTANGGADTTTLSMASTVTVVAINDAPTLTATASNPTFTEAAGVGTQAAAVSIYSGAAASAIESGQTVTSLTFTVSGIVDGASERIAVDGTTITLGANSAGTTATNAMSYSVSIVSGTATVTLTKAAGISAAATQTLVNGITYQNTDTDNPTGGNRVFTLTQIQDNGGTANGGTDTTTLSIASTVNVKSVNDAPTLTATAANPTFTEAAGSGTQAAAVTLYSGAVAGTIESGQTITGLTFTVSGLADGANEVISVDGTTITLGANSSGTTTTNGMSYSVTIASGTATVALTHASGITTAQVQTLVNGITYQDTSTDNPTAGNRVFTMTQIKDNGGTANGGADTATLAIASTVSVVSRNDAPTLTATASNPTFTEAAGLGTQAAAVSIYSGAAVSTIEPGQTITSLTFTVSGLRNGASEKLMVDGKAITLGANSSGTTTTNAMSYTVAIVSGTATVTLTSGAGISSAATQTLVNGITYQNTSTDNPTAGNRVFTLTQVKDSGGTANSGADTTALSMASTVAVVSRNDAPTVTATASNPTFTEPAGLGTQGAAVNMYSGAAVSTIESGQTIASLTFTVGGLVDGAYETLVVDGKTITLGGNSTGTTTTNSMTYTVTVSSGTATVLLTGSASSANTQTLINGITYQNTNADNPTSGNRVFTLTQVKDNGGTANGGANTTALSIASTVTVTPTNDAPTANDDAASTDPATPIDVNVLANDADPDNSLASQTVTIVSNSGGTTATVNPDGSIHFDPGAQTGTLTVVYNLTDAGGLTSADATLTITVAANNAPSGANATTSTLENAPYTLQAGDFGFTDPDTGIGQTFGGISVESLPTAGSLTLNGAAVSAHDVISATDIAANKLVFTPALNANGVGYSSFTFKVQDNLGLSSVAANTLTFDVAPVDSAPTLITTGIDPTFQEAAGSGAQASAVNMFSGTLIDTIEVGQTITGLTFTVSNVVDGANEVIVVDGTTIALGANSAGTTATNSMSYGVTLASGTATVTLTHVAGITTAAADTLVDAITYQNTHADDPSAGDRVFTLTQITDNGSTANGGSYTGTLSATSTVTVVAVNDAPTLSTTVNNPTFTEAAGLGTQAPPVAVFSGTVIDTVEAGQSIVNLTFTVSGVLGGSTASIVIDGTTITLGANSSGTTATNAMAYNVIISAGTATISLDNVAGISVAHAQTLIDAITYQNTNTDNPSAGNRVFTITRIQDDGGTLNGGNDVTTLSTVSTVNVVPVNDAPTLANNNGLTLNESSIASISSAMLAVSDPDNATAQLVFTISGLPAHGQLELASNPGVAISSFSQADLDSDLVRYRHDGSETLSDSLTFTVSDGAGGSIGSTAFNITVTPVNDAPTLSTTALNPTFQEAAGQGTQASAVTVFSGTSISAIEAGQTISGLTITVDGLLDGNAESIFVDGSTITLGANSAGSTATNGMSYSVNMASGTATMSLTKAAGISALNAQNLMDGLSYQNTNTDNPGAGARIFTLTQIQDNGGTSNGGQDTTVLSIVSTVTVTPVNDAPTLTSTSLNPSFIEATGSGNQAAAVQVFSGTSIGMVEAGQTVTGLSFAVTGLLDGANEALVVDGSTITLGTSSSGTTSTNAMNYSVTVSGTNATIVLNSLSGVSTMLAQSLVDGITYQNTNADTPTDGNRVFTLTQIKDSGGTLHGGSDTSTLSQVSTVQVTGTNDAPTLSTTASNPTFTEASGLGTQAPAVAVFTGTSISPIESGQKLSSLTFTISGLVDGANEILTVDGSSLALNVSTSGTTSTNGMGYSITVVGNSATVVLTSASGLTSAAAQTLVNNITYQNTHMDTPTAGNRVFTLTQLADNGGTANSGADTSALNIASTVQVVARNDAPTLTTTSINPSFTEALGLNTQAAAVNVFSGTSINTIEAGQLIRGVGLSITGLQDGIDEVIVIDGTSVTLDANSSGTTSGNGMTYTVAISGQTATISLTKAAGISTANAQSLVDGITYQNTNRDAPSAGVRTFTITQLTDDGGTLNGGTDTQVLALTSNITVSGLNDAFTGAVTISGVTTQNQTLTASNTIADPDGLGTITYHWLRNGIDTGSTGTNFALTQADVNNIMAVRATYVDGGGTTESVTSASTSAVVNVNDAPVMPTSTPLTGYATPSATWTSGALLSQVIDLDNDAMHVVVIQAPQHGTLTMLPNGDVRYTADIGYVGSDTFTYAASDGQASSTGTRQVSVQSLPGGWLSAGGGNTDTTPTTDPNANSNNNGNTDSNTSHTGATTTPATKPVVDKPDASTKTDAGNKADKPTASETQAAQDAADSASQSQLHQRIQGSAWSRQGGNEQVNLGGRTQQIQESGSYAHVLALYETGSASVMHLLELIQPTVTRAADINLLSTPLSAIIHALPAQHASTGLLDTGGDESNAIKLTRAASYSTGLGLSIGTIWWTARVSGLITSALISTPAWRALDPLPVLTSPDDEADEQDMSHLGDKEVEHLFDADRPLELDLPIIQ